MDQETWRIPGPPDSWGPKDTHFWRPRVAENRSAGKNAAPHFSKSAHNSAPRHALHWGGPQCIAAPLQSAWQLVATLVRSEVKSESRHIWVGSSVHYWKPKLLPNYRLSGAPAGGSSDEASSTPGFLQESLILGRRPKFLTKPLTCRCKNVRRRCVRIRTPLCLNSWMAPLWSPIISRPWCFVFPNKSLSNASRPQLLSDLSPKYETRPTSQPPQIWIWARECAVPRVLMQTNVDLEVTCLAGRTASCWSVAAFKLQFIAKWNCGTSQSQRFFYPKV